MFRLIISILIDRRKLFVFAILFHFSLLHIKKENRNISRKIIVEIRIELKEKDRNIRPSPYSKSMIILRMIAVQISFKTINKWHLSPVLSINFNAITTHAPFQINFSPSSSSSWFKNVIGDRSRERSIIESRATSIKSPISFVLTAVSLRWY